MAFNVTRYKKKVITRVVNYLTDLGHYDPIDDDLISMYAQNLSDVRLYSEQIEADGVLTEKSKLHPLIPLKQKAFDNATKLADKLGVLAYNRKRISAGEQKNVEENPFDEFS